MIGDFVNAVEHNDVLRQVLQDTYTYIQVDEFQDTNGAQMRIIELLCDGVDVPNIMAVGDDDQAIMRFQGATIECANQFAAEFSPRSIVLKTNYRSTPAIVEFGQAIARQIEYRLDASSNKSIEASSLRVIRSALARTSTPAKPRNTPLSLRALSNGLMITISMNAKIPMKELQSSLLSMPPCAR